MKPGHDEATAGPVGADQAAGRLPRPTSVCWKMRGSLSLCTALKQEFWRRFVDVVAGRDDAADFARKLGARLPSSTTASECDLVANTPRGLRITEGFRAVQRRAIERCVRIMSRGMAAAPGHCSQSGFDLPSLCPGQNDPAFARGLAEVVAISRQHLQHALRFIEIVPTRETGIRRHCLWALRLAVLTLRRIHARPMFRHGRDVKGFTPLRVGHHRDCEHPGTLQRCSPPAFRNPVPWVCLVLGRGIVRTDPRQGQSE